LRAPGAILCAALVRFRRAALAAGRFLFNGAARRADF